MTNILKHIIIHEVRRDSDSREMIFNLKSCENDFGQTNDSRFKENFFGIFSTAKTNVGCFSLDGDNGLKPPFEQYLEEYYTNQISFVEISHRLAKLYKAKIDNLTNVNGGFLVIYEYEKTSKPFLAVIVINKTKGVDINASLDLIASQIVDIDKLHLGAVIDISQWQTDNSTRFIKFKKGVSKELRDYFQEFIGCEIDKDAAKIETAALKRAIQSFCDSNSITNDIKEKSLRDAHSYIVEKQRQGELILLEHIANHIFPDKSDDFLRLAITDHNISNEIKIDKTTLRSYRKFSTKNAAFSLSFDRELLGKSIFFDKETEELKIKELPKDLINHLNDG